MTKPLSGKAVSEALSRIGKSHGDIARELGVNRTVVRGVIYGRLKGDRGDAHKVAVALGMKDGVIVDGGTSISEAIKALAA